MNHTTAVVVLLQIAMLHWCGSAAHGDEPTDSLIDQLQSSDWDVEKRAARQLVALGAEAVAPLLAEGRSRYASRRGRAILVLGRIGPESRQATDILIDALDDRKSYSGPGLGPTVRDAAIPALAAIGRDASASVLAALGDKRLFVRASACDVIGRSGPYNDEALKLLTERLQDEEDWVRRESIYSLAEFGTRGIPALIRALDDSRRDVRSATINALKHMETAATPAIPTLIRLTKEDPDRFCRSDACRCIAKVGPKSPVVASALTRALRDAEPQVRGHAALALAEISPHTEAVASALAARLGDTSGFNSGDIRVYRVCQAAALAIEQSGPAARKAVPALVEALRRKDSEVTQTMLIRVAEALGALGPLAADAAPQLLTEIKDEKHADVRNMFAMSLLRISPEQPDALQSLIVSIEIDDPYSAWLSVQAIGRFGSRQRTTATTALAKTMRDSDSHRIRMAAAVAILRLDPQNNAALKVFRVECDPRKYKWNERDPWSEYEQWSDLCKVLKTHPAARKNVVPPLVAALEAAISGPDDFVIVAGLEAVASIGPDAHPAVPEVLRFWGRTFDTETRLAIRRIGAAGVPHLRKALTAGDAPLRETAAEALAEIGPAASAAVPQLIDRLADPDMEVRRAIIQALVQIAPNDRAVIDAFVKALNDKRAAVRADAANALGQVGADDENVRMALRKAFLDEYLAVSHAAKSAYERIGE